MDVELLSYKKFLVDYCGVSEENAVEVFKKWNEPWRFYHGEKHLLTFLRAIRKIENITAETADNMVIAAIFHDVVYLPWGEDNERKSLDVMERFCTKLSNSQLDQVSRLIMVTAQREMPVDDEVLKLFWCIDNDILLQPKIDKLMEYEKQIRKEFQFVDYAIYKQKRLEFLQNWAQANVKHVGTNCIYKLDMLGAFIRDYRPKIGVYAGSFNPLHKGHLNVIEKAEEVFDKVVIALGQNPEKSINDNETRLKEVKEAVIYRQVDIFDGLLSDYLESKQETVDTYLVRGLRNGTDLSYEQNQLWFINKVANTDVNVVCFLCDEEYKNISSSAIRSLQKINDTKTREFVKTLLPHGDT